MATYGYTILYVEDVAATMDFYVKAFGLSQKLMSPDNDYAELDTGGTTLAFAAYSVAEYNGIQIAKSAADGPPYPVELAFVFVDVAAAYAQALDAGAQALAEPKQKPWGQTVAYVRDLNGFLVELCSPVS